MNSPTPFQASAYSVSTQWRLQGALQHRRQLLATLVVGGLFSLLFKPSFAQTTLGPVGMVKTVAGQAFLELNGQRVPAVLGSLVYLGSRLVTASGSTLGITFKDETVMSIGPDTQLVIDQYLFAPREGKLSLIASLTRGTLNYVSGQIAKLRPDGVNVNTPTGMIGVRGTQFVVRVDPQ